MSYDSGSVIVKYGKCIQLGSVAIALSLRSAIVQYGVGIQVGSYLSVRYFDRPKIEICHLGFFYNNNRLGLNWDSYQVYIILDWIWVGKDDESIMLAMVVLEEKIWVGCGNEGRQSEGETPAQVASSLQERIERSGNRGQIHL